jgi:predicted methyltransferase
MAAVLAAAVIGAPAPAQTQGAPAASHETKRDEWQRVDDIFAAMKVKPGAVVADVGAGDGYFTTRLAAAVGRSGKVHAIDVNPVALGRLKTTVAEAGLENVEIVHGSVDDPKLLPASIDAALIVNAYHEMDEHQAMLAKIRAALKPEGRLVIVEPISPARKERPRAEQTRNHEIALDLVRTDARDAGFTEVAAHESFTSRPNGHGTEWMLVLTPASSAVALREGRTQSAAEVFSSKNDAWKAPELRISLADFKKLSPDDVLVIDVRDPESYRRGRLPGAVLMTPEELSTSEGQARLRGERRLIVAYCS